MEENKKAMAQAILLLSEQKVTQAEPILKELAANGDVEAKFTLAGLYLWGGDGIVKNEAECIRLLKDAADNDNYEPAAGMLSAIFYEGLGTQVNYAESALYAKKVTDDETNDTEPWKGIVYNILGMMSATGNGITKNIPKAWHLFKFAIGLGSEDAELNLEKLGNNYPMTEDGKIDLSQKGRSKLLTFFLVICLLFSCWVTYLQYTNSYSPDMPVVILVGAFALTCLLNLIWIPYSAYGFLAFFVGGILAFINNFLFLFGDDSSFRPSTVAITLNGLGMVSFIMLMLMQKRKTGYAHPWNILTQRPYDGRGLFETLFSYVLQYGDGEEYKSESQKTKVANILLYVVLALLGAFCLYSAWTIVNMEFDFDIEWNCFNSPRLYGTLSFIGFFLQFFNWQHFSFKTFYEWKDPNSGEKKRKESKDMMDVVEGGFLWPFLCHVFLVPMLYGAMLYYVIMGGFAILQGIMPWLLGALCVASIYPVYNSMKRIPQRRFRFALLPVAGILYFMVYSIAVLVIKSFTS